MFIAYIINGFENDIIALVYEKLNCVLKPVIYIFKKIMLTNIFIKMIRQLLKLM